MLAFYFFSIAMAVLAIFSTRGFLFALVLGCAYFLLTLPSTGYDYDHYRQAFEYAYFTGEFPWFKTTGSITAEPFYLWYNSVIGVTMPFGFEFFLAFNFLFCFGLSYFFLRKMPKDYPGLFWLALLPVVFPTIFYFSPRSSISFFLVMGGMIYLGLARARIAVVLFMMGVMIHSQYIPISAFLIGTYTLLFLTRKLQPTARNMVVIGYALAAIFLLAKLELIMDYVSAFLGVLPGGDFAVAKLHYLDGASSGMRVTALLSVVIYPILFYLLFIKKRKGALIFFQDKEADFIFITLLFVTVLFGAAINLIFFDAAHVAGRLGRFSDYLSMGLLLPVVMRLYGSRPMAVAALFLLIVIAPFLYPTVYDF